MSQDLGPGWKETLWSQQQLFGQEAGVGEGMGEINQIRCTNASASKEMITRCKKKIVLEVNYFTALVKAKERD